MLTNQSNARYRWYKRHCAFISPISFSDTVQKRRRFVHEIAERDKNTSDTSCDHTSSDNFRSCNPGVFDSGAT